MDLGTIIGLLAGVGMLLGAILCASPLTPFVHVPSLMMVVGGACCAALVSFPTEHLAAVAGILKKTIFSAARDPRAMVEAMVGYAEVARRDGVFALERCAKNTDDPFVVQGLHMVVDGCDPELIESALMGHIEALEARHAEGKALFDNVGRFAPAFGMIGTLVGLVIMLRDMRDPTNIGPALAMALLTTLYGAVLANLIALPLAEKLARRSRQEVLLKMIAVRGIRAIQCGDNPRLVWQKLNILLPAGGQAESRGARAA
jgi:chemotaxis protein MotA